jgi:hypothetical protein
MSKPEVFIIESLNFDEEESYREGEMIARSLKMSLKNPVYRYVRTKLELQHFVDEFEDSNYRYLHISCHGTKTGISTTLDDLSIDEFSSIVGPALEAKRLFLSTCQASTSKMAKAIFSKGGCTSLAGPVNKINFDDSVVLWTAFYHLMFKANAKTMRKDDIKKTISQVAGLLGEPVNFFASRKGKIFSDTVLPIRNERSA